MTDKPKVDPLLRNIGKISSPSRFFSPTVRWVKLGRRRVWIKYNVRAWTRTLSAAAPPIPVIVEIHLDQMWDAQDVVFAAIQRRNFPAEIEEIRRKNINNPDSRKELLIKSSALLKLNPFMDAQGVVRVGSRLAKAKIPEEKKFPAILPRKDENVRTWIRYNHTRELHAGVEKGLPFSAVGLDMMGPFKVKIAHSCAVHKC